MRTGLRENWAQFTLLVVVNAFVGAMVGLERSILPALAEDELGLVASTAILSFIVVFGLTKAAMNSVAGRVSERWGRRPALLAGWVLAAPVPVLLYLAPSWAWILGANALLGLSQGLTWSTTVIMKIDLAGDRQRGLAMGLNEFAGYLAVALAAVATGVLAEAWGLRAPLLLGLAFVALGGGLSLFARETRELANPSAEASLGFREVFARTSLRDPNLSSSSQAGFVNNLNDGLAWGLFPLVFALAGLDLAQIGVLAGVYPAVWGLGQLVTGPLSDKLGRKPLIVGGMLVQALGLALVALGLGYASFVAAAVLLGLGTAMVYPTLLASIADNSGPGWRASAVGVYRLWRDSGYAAGALLAGVLADLFGAPAAIWAVAALTLASGVLVQLRMRPISPASAPPAPTPASPPEPVHPR